MPRNKVVLVDTNDKAIGIMDVLEAHQKGELHRAFSIFIFNDKGQMLIHQRAEKKYHGGGLWTNACCSHPQWEENVRESALERLQFEMGFKCAIEHAFSFIYKTPVENQLIEHEYDHVFIGSYNDSPNPDPDEVQNFMWIYPDDLQRKILLEPEQFTFWFKTALGRVLEYVEYNSSTKADAAEADSL